MTKVHFKTTRERVFELNHLACLYLSSYLFRFLFRNSIPFDLSKAIEVPNELSEKLKEIILYCLQILLDETYQEPSPRAIQKHPGRYERIKINDKKYVINYRMSESGRLAYSIHALYQWLSGLEFNIESIIIEYVEE